MTHPCPDLRERPPPHRVVRRDRVPQLVGADDAAQLRRLLTDFDTIILMKVGGVMPQILAALEELELLESTMYAERIGMPEEYIVQGQALQSLKGQRRPYLSLLIVRTNQDD